MPAMPRLAAALALQLLASAAPASGAAPSVHTAAAFEVKEQLAVPYGQGVLCNAKPCVYCKGGERKNGPPKCDESCQNPEPGGAPMPPAPGCPKPAVYNLTLDLYTPVGAEELGPRPAFVAIHSGGYAVNGESGFGKSYEMAAACRYFASRGWVAITMIYRMDNEQTGGGLAPANWTQPSPVGSAWAGGFKPSPQAIYPAIRDTKHAIRWLRGQATALNLDTAFFASAGWSAGACTSAFLASQFEADFTAEMSPATDPTFHTMEPYLHLSGKVAAGVVWAGNGIGTDTIDALDGVDRYTSTSKTPLAMYRGAKDGTMTPWAQAEVQRMFNSSGGHVDLFAVPGHGHGDLMPTGIVATKNGVPVVAAQKVPVLNHSYTWLVQQMKLAPV
eukprot:SAG22_NODE_808_length_7080_cov_4.802034_5_plen_388_part_00